VYLHSPLLAAERSVSFGILWAGVPESCDPRHAGKKFSKHLKTLAVHLFGVQKYPGDIATRPAEARCEPASDRITLEVQRDDWDGLTRWPYPANRC